MNTEVTERRLVAGVGLTMEDGNHKQSAMKQLFLDSFDRMGQEHAACVSFRRRSMHEHDKQSRTLRPVDPIMDEGVWVIVDDGCISCCHGEVWRRNAESKNS